MTTLPARNLLDGSKLPKTTTGEMKEALGKLHDYLNEMLGSDSADKETARLQLGIDLARLTAEIDAKADRNALQTAMAELGNRLQALEENLSKSRIPVGALVMFPAAEAPAGYLRADGSALGRQAYPELFAVIGTSFGAGDGETTFNLPNLIGRFAEGSATPGTVKEAGLPNIGGRTWSFVYEGFVNQQYGAMKATIENASTLFPTTATGVNNFKASWVDFDASRSSPVYGKSATVQPPALTLLPCIRASNT